MHAQFIDPNILHLAFSTLLKIFHCASRLHSNGVVPDIIEVLVEACPESAKRRNNEGQLPLHIAAVHGIGGLSQLIKAYPAALRQRCPVVRLYPFQLAATHSDSNSYASYQLLQTAQHLQ